MKTESGNKPVRKFTKAEVAKHDKVDDCWLIVEDKVYDVTSFIEKHPGGDIIKSHAGADATDIFACFHAEGSRKFLPRYEIGLVSDLKLSDKAKKTRQLREEMVNANIFRSSKMYYAYKVASNLSILACSILLLAYALNSFTLVLSATLMALFWQQCGWLAHDFLHHQVFTNRKFNNLAGYFIGNLAQGFAVSWWKAKHNMHHAAPNVVDFDSDIDTLPFLAWSEKVIDHEMTGLPDFLVRNQKYVYWPLLCVARISWLIQSALWPVYHEKHRAIEATSIIAHWVWYLYVLNRYLSLPQAISYFVISECTAGFLLGVVFTLGHNGMDVYGKNEFHNTDFVNVQLNTTRDVNGPLFVHWFMGGLDFQLEHHMWPMIPRHNLAKARDGFLAPFLQKQGLKIYSTDFFPGLGETVRRLENVTSFYKSGAKQHKE